MIDPKTIEREALEFFFVYSRFEFALKAAGYITSFGKSENAVPDWHGFIKEFKREFAPSEMTKGATLYLLENPPQKQKYCRLSEVARWEALAIEPKDPQLKSLVDVVQTIRNNLFHGGKYGEKGWDDEKRVIGLLSNGIAVLKEWSKLNDDLEHYFNDWS